MWNTGKIIWIWIKQKINKVQIDNSFPMCIEDIEIHCMQ